MVENNFLLNCRYFSVQDLESKYISAQKEIKVFETVKEEVAFLKELESDKKQQLNNFKHNFSSKELVASLEEELKVLRQDLAFAKENSNSSSEELEKIKQLLNNTQIHRDDAQRRVKALEIVECDENVKSADELATFLKERESNQKDAIKELESILTYLETELVMVKDYSKIDKETISNLEEKLSILAKATKMQINNFATELAELNKISSAHLDSVIKSYENIVNNIVEDLNNQLKKSFKSNSRTTRSYQVEQLQKNLETLAKEFAEAASKFEDADELSRQQKTCIAELESALQEAKKNYSEDIANGFNKFEHTNPSLVKLATNESLNAKIVEAEEQTQVLNDKVKFLANELTQLGSNIKINPQFSKDINDITPVSDDDNISSREQSKLSRQEATIAQQNNVIKSLQDKISELEESHKLLQEQILRHSNLTTINTRFPTFSIPPKPDSESSRHRSDSSTSSELTIEIQKLQKKITKMENKNLQNNQLVETLESSLNENETNLRKQEFLEQLKNLRAQLDDAQQQVEQAKSTVREKKKAMESILEEERKVKEKAEKARIAIESQMEKLVAKRNKFMCF
ncbi:37645_t:CDS:10 [Gigaspora margarita]|uniref:37645_t:CDS:1 n=1 Tax=Gigaspora margarita TaxID=4874 RepID=A0ABM8W0U2_GIGMA|nr:37645_t:CDS:10 [Gigaspora margarita]